MKRIIQFLACASIILAGHGLSVASYPNRPVQVLVPAAPGGGTSLVGRIIADRLQAELGQPFVLVNRGGGGGRIATNEVAKATPDGYTLLLTFGGPIASGVGLFKSMPYNVERDFAPVGLVAQLSIMLVASPQFSAKSVDDVLRYAKANPDKMTASISSAGSMGHLMTELFVTQHNIKINRIPYKGSGDAMRDFIAGRIDIAFDTLPTLVPFVQQMNVTPLAVASNERSPFLPNVPTFKELGIEGMEAAVWYAMLAPAGTPPEAIAQLSKALSKILKSEEVRSAMSNLGVTPIFSTPKELGELIRDETKKWNAVIDKAGLSQTQ